MAEKTLTAVIHEAHLRDVSTRSVDERVKGHGHGGISKSQLSRLCGEIDERVQTTGQRDEERRTCVDSESSPMLRRRSS